MWIAECIQIIFNNIGIVAEGQTDWSYPTKQVVWEIRGHASAQYQLIETTDGSEKKSKWSEQEKAFVNEKGRIGCSIN